MTGNAIHRPIYLSRLLLGPASHRARSELAFPYEMHRTLMHAFEGHFTNGEVNPREKAGVLFRADVSEGHDRIIVYVQSIVEPDWSFLDGVPDYLLGRSGLPNPACKDVSSAYQRLREGQILSFRLRANPTKRIGQVVGDNPELKGKRVGLLREEEQIAWLKRKGHERESGKPGGFELPSQPAIPQNEAAQTVPLVQVRQEGKQVGRKRSGRQAHTTTHLAIRFDGRLRITDADAFRETLVRGVGSAKAYGFGLLSIGAPGAP